MVAVDVVWGHQIQVVFVGCQWAWGVTQERSDLGTVQRKGVNYQQQNGKYREGQIVRETEFSVFEKAYYEIALYVQVEMQSR